MSAESETIQELLEEVNALLHQAFQRLKAVRSPMLDGIASHEKFLQRLQGCLHRGAINPEDIEAQSVMYLGFAPRHFDSHYCWTCMKVLEIMGLWRHPVCPLQKNQAHALVMNLRSLLLDSISYELLTSDEYAKQQASQGGKARAMTLQPAKAEVIRLLNKKRPPGGWKYRTTAINDIVDELWSFVKSRNLDLQEHSLDRRIENWARHDAEVRAAFERHVARKSKKKTKAKR